MDTPDMPGERKNELPKPPPHTRTGGKRLWYSVVAAYELEEHELILLRQMTRTVDDLDALADVVRRHGVVVDGRMNPALVEQRQMNIVLARLAAALRLPAGEEDGRPQRRLGVRGTYGMGPQRRVT